MCVASRWGLRTSWKPKRSVHTTSCPFKGPATGHQLCFWFHLNTSVGWQLGDVYTYYVMHRETLCLVRCRHVTQVPDMQLGARKLMRMPCTHNVQFVRAFVCMSGLTCSGELRMQ